jgi:hypothetical protein
MSYDKGIVIPEAKPSITFELAPVIESLPEVALEEVKREKVLSYEVHVCIPCKRLFRSIETLNKHKMDSILHIKVAISCCQLMHSRPMNCSRSEPRKKMKPARGILLHPVTLVPLRSFHL